MPPSPNPGRPVLSSAPPRPSRREEILVKAAGLFAERGFAGVTIDDIGAACGISGPALYHHFTGKEAMLGEMLVSISEHLVALADDIIERYENPARALHALVAAHIDFAVSRPDLIAVHERDLVHAEADHQRAVRRLQRRYVEHWVDTIKRVIGGADVDRATIRVVVHGVFGMLNSTPRVPSPTAGKTAPVLEALARRLLEREALVELLGSGA